MLKLTEFCYNAYKYEGFNSAIVYGRQAKGKTSYALHVAHELYGDWDKVLEHLFFNPMMALEKIEESLKLIEKGENGRIPLIIMDDAGIWLSKYNWWDKTKVAFTEFYELMRSVCSNIIFTATSLNLMKGLLDKVWYRIHILPVTQKNLEDMKHRMPEIYEKFDEEELSKLNLARIYELHELPSGMKRVRLVDSELYPRFYPNPVYKKYNKIRVESVRDKFSEVKEIFESLNGDNGAVSSTQRLQENESAKTHTERKKTKKEIVIEEKRKNPHLRAIDIARKHGINYGYVRNILAVADIH